VQRICKKCITYRKENFRIQPHGLYTLLHVPKKPWVDISMDFVLGLPRSKQGRGLIFVLVDRFFKLAYFIACHKIDDATNIVDLFYRVVVWIYRVHMNIVSDTDVEFLSYFLKVLWVNLSTKLLFSTIWHPQIDGQIEIINRTLTQLLHTIIQKNLKN